MKNNQSLTCCFKDHRMVIPLMRNIFIMNQILMISWKHVVKVIQINQTWTRWSIMSIPQTYNLNNCDPKVDGRTNFSKYHNIVITFRILLLEHRIVIPLMRKKLILNKFLMISWIMSLKCKMVKLAIIPTLSLGVI